jgi:hypothetical protein
MVRLWSNKHFRALLWAVLGAIRAAEFQSVTTKMGAVTAGREFESRRPLEADVLPLKSE